MSIKVLVMIVGIAAALFFIGISDLVALGIWIYLTWMILRKKLNVFSNLADPEIAQKLLKSLSIYLLIAGVSFIAFIFWAVKHNVHTDIPETEKAVSLVIALVAHVVFVVATSAGFAVFLDGRQKAV